MKLRNPNGISYDFDKREDVFSFELLLFDPKRSFSFPSFRYKDIRLALS